MKTASATAVVLATVFLAPAIAASKRGPASDYYITVPSAVDPGSKVTGLVQFGPHGDQVRLPNGTWVLCAINCEVTLRQNTYDLWERRERYRWWGNGRPD